MGMVTVRPAAAADAEAIAAIYNEGIEDRVATFETRPRTVDEVAESGSPTPLPFLVAVEDGVVLGFARVTPYSDRCVYDGRRRARRLRRACGARPRARRRAARARCARPPRRPGSTSSPQPHLHRQRREPRGAPSRRASRRSGSSAATGGSTASGRTACWSSGCSATPHADTPRAYTAVFVFEKIGDGLWNALLMAWEVWWALVLGFRSRRSCRRGSRASAIQAALAGEGLAPLARATGARRGLLVVLLRGDRDRQEPVPEGRQRAPARSPSSSPRRTSCGSSGSCCGCCSAGSSRSPSTSAGS